MVTFVYMFIYLLIGSKDTCEAKQSELDEDGGMESDTETRESDGLNKQEGKENVAPDNPPKKRRRKRLPKVCAIIQSIILNCIIIWAMLKPETEWNQLGRVPAAVFCFLSL